MNQQQTQQAIHTLSTAGLLGLIEGQAEVWLLALDDLRHDDVQAAVRKVVATRTSRERWVTPGDIREAVAVVHHERTERAKPEIARRVPQSVIEVGGDITWKSLAESAMRQGATLAEATRFATDRVLGGDR
ncbi:hypothetical protein MHY85_03210 [Cellulomonas sp. ACRRI]|uniref:hypothetical protein n=1 Tax=Cellulomonas sp. ACRRI TaxID=2918188 RepID=UPI001EF30F06|nr:hypothetical protein [Cellulomonas sp. ACRRI]MCG7284981.1 hypothetical protein [Cellulomonas sp. ACRRI]